MTPIRFTKRLAACLAIALACAGCWRWTHSRAVAGLAVREAQAPAIAAAQAPPTRTITDPASAQPADPAAIARADDARCSVKPALASTQRDASDNPMPDAVAPAPAPDPRALASRARLLARLRASPDPYANAVAVWLDVGDNDDVNHRAERLRQLAAMAASTRDPRLYSLALRTCWRRTDAACQSLSARRWTELEPDNAMPWLLMVDEAGAQGDLSGMQEALFHAARSARLAERRDAPLQPIIDAAADGADSLVAAQSLAVEAIGIAAAQVAPIGYTMCRRATPADANAWQQCVAMADLLAQRSDSLQARMTGAAIERRLTGDAQAGERVAAQFKQMLALDLASASGCADLRAKLAVLRRMAVEGEAALPSR